MQNKAAEISAQEQAIGNYRWTICALIFFATTINYLDRAVISLLKSFLENDFKWTETDYSNIVIAFQTSYAVGLLLVTGRWREHVLSNELHVAHNFMFRRMPDRFEMIVASFEGLTLYPVDKTKEPWPSALILFSSALHEETGRARYAS